MRPEARARVTSAPTPPAPSPPASDSSPDGPETRPRRPGGVRRLAGLGFWLTVLGLGAFNAWWAYDQARPLVPLTTINDWIREGRYDEAEPALKRHLRRSPHHDQARVMLARALAGRQDMRGCAEQLARVPDWSPLKAEARYFEGQAYWSLRQARRAEEAWRACIDDDPHHPTPPRYFHDAARHLLDLYALQDRREEARDVIASALDRTDRRDVPALLITHLRIELERVEPAEAARRLRTFVEADPQDWPSRRALARREQALGRPNEALRQIQRCLNARPDDPSVWRDRLWIAHQQGDLADALSRMPDGLPGADDDAEIWMYRGLVREHAGNPIGAVEAFEQAVRLRPVEPQYHDHLARTLTRLDRHDAAASHRRRSQELAEIRAALRDAFNDFTRAWSGHSDDFASPIARLADLCARLDWPRAAEAWADLDPAAVARASAGNRPLPTAPTTGAGPNR